MHASCPSVYTYIHISILTYLHITRITLSQVQNTALVLVSRGYTVRKKLMLLLIKEKPERKVFSITGHSKLLLQSY